MTNREVQIALKNIETRNYNDIALSARLKGHKIRMRDHSYYKPKDPGKNKSFSKKEAEFLDKHMEMVLSRKGLKPRNGHKSRR